VQSVTTFTCASQSSQCGTKRASCTDPHGSSRNPVHNSIDQHAIDDGDVETSVTENRVLHMQSVTQPSRFLLKHSCNCLSRSVDKSDRAGVTLCTATNRFLTRGWTATEAHSVAIGIDSCFRVDSAILLHQLRKNAWNWRIWAYP
jgi:hypothetical protein